MMATNTRLMAVYQSNYIMDAVDLEEDMCKK